MSDEGWCAEQKRGSEEGIERLPIAVVDSPHEGVVENADGCTAVDEHEHDILVQVPGRENCFDGDGVDDEDDEVDEGVGEGEDDEVGGGDEAFGPDVRCKSDSFSD